MTENAINEILDFFDSLDDILKYWIFMKFIEKYEHLDFLKAEIDYEIEKREKK